MKSLISIFLISVFLSGCATPPEHANLNDLKGKTLQEKQAILYDACLDEVKHISKNGGSNSYRRKRQYRSDYPDPAIGRLREICYQMNSVSAQNE